MTAVLVPYADAQHASGVRRMYELAFPASLSAPWEAIAHARDDEELLVLADDGPVGFTLVRHLGTTSFTFVRYFAIDDERRGRGLGGRLMTLLLAHLREQGRTALLLDVEDPAGDPHHADDDRRRIAFYERQGLAVLSVPGYAPPDHGSTGEVVPLLLMGMSIGEGPPLTGALLDECVRAVYEHRYGVSGPTA